MSDISSWIDDQVKSTDVVLFMRAGLIEAQGPPVSDADAAQISSATLFLVEHEEEAGVLAGFRVPPRMSQKHEDLGSDAFERSAEIVRAMGVRFMPYERPVSKDRGRWNQAARPEIGRAHV